MTISAILHQDAVPPGAVVLSFQAVEGLSVLSDAVVRFIHEDPNIDLDELLWKQALVEVYESGGAAGGDATSYFHHGVIEEAEYEQGAHWQDGRAEGHIYRLRLRPTFHGLHYRVRSRIFQNKTAVEVIKQVFRDAGVPEDKVVWHTAEYSKRSYCTQWKESELAFVLRLLEEEGIYYWIEHREDRHVLHLSDDSTQPDPIDGDAIIRVTDRSLGIEHAQHAWDVRLGARFTHDVWHSRDWNWKFPDTAQEGRFGLGEGAALEVYEYPGGFLGTDEGKRHATDRVMAHVCRRTYLHGKTTCRRFSPGRKFDLDGAYPLEISRAYMVTRARHTFDASVLVPDQPRTWATDFEAVPSGTTFRPLPVTPKPRAAGKESAVVVGPSGEEIHVDEMGQIKVHFYWDREGAPDENASCWIRPMQMNAETTMVLPRMGWEVDVGFLHGDPDRPVMLQKVYNDETLPPYALPANLATSALQSSSSPGAGGTNEIRMCDTSGSQQFFVHAQKDMSTTVGNHVVEEITVDSKIQVTCDAKQDVGGNETVDITGNQKTSVTGEATHETSGTYTTTVGATDDIGVKTIHSVKCTGARTDKISGIMNVVCSKGAEEFGANHDKTVGGALMINAISAISDAVAGNKTLTIAGARICLVKGSVAENIGAAKALTSGKVEIKTGADIAVSAEGAIGYKAGSFDIKCGKDISISGSTVTLTIGKADLDAGGKVGITGGAITLNAGEVNTDAPDIVFKGTIKFE